MLPTFNPKITQADFPAAGQPFSSRFISNFSAMTSQLYQAVNGGLGLHDNMNGAVVTLSLAHGVPYLYASPLQSMARPIGVQAIGCDTQAIPSMSMTASATVNGVLTTAPSGYVFLTALYPLAEQFVLVSTTAAQSINSAAETVLTFAAAPAKSIGTKIVYGGSSTFTVSMTGLYDVRGNFRWAAGGTGIRFISLLSGGVRLGAQGYLANGSANLNYCTTAMIVPMAAGASIQVEAFQDSGGALSTNPATTFPAQFEIRQLSNDSSLTANVTLFMAGS